MISLKDYNLEQYEYLTKEETIDCFLSARDMVLGRYRKIDGKMYGLVVKDQGLCQDCPTHDCCSDKIRTTCMIADDMIYDAFNLVSCCRIISSNRLTDKEADQIEDRYELLFGKSLTGLTGLRSQRSHVLII